MNIQARKLVLIEEFLRISDEAIISKIESIIFQEKQKTMERELHPMSVNEFHEMIEKSKQDSDSGRLISHEELKKKIKSWK
jgi:hypothetical protein